MLNKVNKSSDGTIFKESDIIRALLGIGDGLKGEEIIEFIHQSSLFTKVFRSYIYFSAFKSASISSKLKIVQSRIIDLSINSILTVIFLPSFSCL